MQTNQELFDEVASTNRMDWNRAQAHNALTFGDGYLTTGPCWQQHNTMPELELYWGAENSVNAYRLRQLAREAHERGIL